jgi:GNAT superfamily N-acetyltransferase
MAGTVGEIAPPGPAPARRPRGLLHNPRMTPTPTPDIRPAARADLPAIVGLIRELAVYEKLEHLAAATPERLEPHLFGPRPAAECLVAEQGGAVVAFALFFHNFSTFLCKPGLYLEDLYVQPAARGTGLGRRLLQRLAAIAVERGCGRFEWSVLDWNVDAQAFYTRMGAAVLPDWRIVRATGDALAAMAAAAD